MVRSFDLKKGKRYQHFFHKYILYEYLERKKKIYVFRVIKHKDPREIGKIRYIGQSGLRLFHEVEHVMTNKEALIYLKLFETIPKRK